LAAKLGFAVRGPGRGRFGEPMTVYALRRDDWVRRLWSGRSETGLRERSGM